MPLRLRLRDLAARGCEGVCEEQGSAATLRVRTAGGHEDGVCARRKDALRVHRGGPGGGVHAVLYLRVREDGAGGDRTSEGPLRTGTGSSREPALGGAGRGLRRRDCEEQEAVGCLGGCGEEGGGNGRGAVAAGVPHAGLREVPW